MLLTVKGIVLREIDIGEYDKMLTVLTGSNGRISVFAGGVKRLKSPHFVATQLYSYSEFTLYSSGDKYYIRECSQIKSFFGLRETLAGISLSAYIAEVACDVSLEEENEEKLLRLVLNSLYCIEAGTKPPALIKAVFELRVAGELGFLPNLVGCAGCGKSELETYYFDIEDGVFRCDDCYHRAGAGIEKDAGRASEAESIYAETHLIAPLSPSVFAAMRFVLYSKPERLFAFELKDEATDEFSSVCEKYLLCHLERGFDSLDFYNGIK